MTAFLPRSRRITTELRVAVLLIESEGGYIAAGPAPALLCNLSVTGCCIEIESPLVEGHHLFFSTLDSEKHHLEVDVVLPGYDEVMFQVSAFSIWMNGTDEDRPPGFRIGLNFFERQVQLFKAISRL